MTSVEMRAFVLSEVRWAEVLDGELLFSLGVGVGVEAAPAREVWVDGAADSVEGVGELLLLSAEEDCCEGDGSGVGEGDESGVEVGSSGVGDGEALVEGAGADEVAPVPWAWRRSPWWR